MERHHLPRFPWVIFGCGYTGQWLARRLVEGGANVIAVRRSTAALAALAKQLGSRFAIRRAEISDGFSADWIPKQSIVIDSVPPNRDAQNHGDYERALVTAASAAGAQTIVYLSSTGVYPRGTGDWFDGATPPAPLSSRGEVRLACESAFREVAKQQGIKAITLRIPGIYGPNRGIFSRLRSGTFRRIGPGNTSVSRIHVQDLASAIIASGLRANDSSIYTVADDEPCPSRTIVEAAIADFGVPVPVEVPIEQVSPDIAAMVTANRKISNRAMKTELRVALAFPTWREGMRAIFSAPPIPNS